MNPKSMIPESKIHDLLHPLRVRLMAAEDIAEQVGRFTREHAQDRISLEISLKGPQDFVSTADRDAEQLARRLILERFPSDAIVGEEGGGEAGDCYWIIDPIDGTTNFLSGLPLWAVSIAYVVEGVPVVGALALPMLNELLTAAQSLGMRRNRQAMLPVSRRGPMLAAIGRNLQWLDNGYRNTERQLESAGYSLVSLGSCASELAFVALGGIDGYVQRQVNNWDIAAGVVLCREAGIDVDVIQEPGGKVSVIAGTESFRAICSS